MRGKAAQIKRYVVILYKSEQMILNCTYMPLKVNFICLIIEYVFPIYAIQHLGFATESFQKKVKQGIRRRRRRNAWRNIFQEIV